MAVSTSSNKVSSQVQINSSTLMGKTEGAKNNASDAKKKSVAQDKVNEYQKKIKDSEREVYANLDTAMAVMEKLPAFVDVGMDVLTSNSFNFSLSPLGLLMDLLSKLGVTDEELKAFLVNLLVDVLPAVELGIKASLLSNIKSIVSCAADPRIPKQLRQRTGEYYFDELKYKFKSYDGTPSAEAERGMLIDCDSIDPEGILSFSPYSDKGKNYYFGVLYDEMTKFLKDLGVSKNAGYNIVQKTDGSNEVNRNAIYGNMRSKWELCRAEDRNAFIWFVMHVAKFPSPTEAVISGQTVSINGTKFVDMSGQDGKTSLFTPMNLNVIGENESSNVSVGTAIVNENTPNEIALCIGANYEEQDISDTGATRIFSNQFVPVSSNWNSADLYVDKTKYYNYNIGYKSKSSIDDYTNQIAICNLQYMQPTDYATTYVGGSTQKLKFTILPKPYVYLPYVDTGEPIWRAKRILFDAYGNPDPNGAFSLPTERMNSKNLPYVHNDKIGLFNSNMAVTEAMNNASYLDNLKNVAVMIYSETADGVKDINKVKAKIVETYEAHEILAFKMSIEAWKPSNSQSDPTDTDSTKAKYISVLTECLNTKIAKSEENHNGYVKLMVGEEEDSCGLYISIDTGDYFLADYNDINNREGDYTKHLVQCYKGLTVYEFNYDFVMGMKLLDSKVVCYKLLEAATNPSNDASFEVGFDFVNKSNDGKSDINFNDMRNSIVEIVREIVETEDSELSDCFFKFDNSRFESMLKTAEEKRYNQQPYINDKNNSVDFTDVYGILQEYPEYGTKEEQKKVISNVITAATAKISQTNGSTLTTTYTTADTKKVKINFTTNMISQLVSVIVESILSPKLLMLIAVNKQLMGDGGETFNTNDLLNGMKGVVVGIVKEIRDLIIKKILDYVLDSVGKLAVELKVEVEKEQISVYQNILSQLLALLNVGKSYYTQLNSVLEGLKSKFSGSEYYNNGNGYDYDLPTIIDNVGYADIITNNNTDKPVSTDNC